MSVPIAGARMSGNRGDAVVFVHGVGSTAAIWDYQLQDLGDRYRCFAIELRGNGARKPEPPPESITREGFALDVLTVADAASAARFHFVGCSLGGVVAFELWRTVPERIASLTLVGTFAKYQNGETYARDVVAAVHAAGTMERFASARAAKLGLPPGVRTDETIAQMACKDTASYIASTHATWTGDYRSLLPSISCPVLVVRGENDGVAPAPYADEIVDAIPGARMEVIGGGGHVVNADVPDRFNAVLRSFLEM
jgi:pimeloyl-ACP methyl ester carboxylesterase